jgi:integrase
MFVFPTRKGTPYSESGMQSAWRRAKKKAGLDGVDAVFRDLRTTELNEVKKAGGDATATAGHADQRTTAPHYLTVPTRVKPRR